MTAGGGLRLAHHEGFLITLTDGSSVDYSDASCTATVAAELGSQPSRLSTPVVHPLSTKGNPPTAAALVLARVGSLLLEIGDELGIEAADDIDTVEVVRLGLEISRPSALEVLVVLDAVAARHPASLRLPSLEIDFDGAGAATMTITAIRVGESNDRLVLRCEPAAALRLLADSLTLPRIGAHGFSAAGLAATGEAGGLTEAAMLDAVGRPLAVVDVVAKGSACETSLAFGESTAGLLMRSSTATFVRATSHELALSALTEAVWGDGTRPSGLCDIRVRSEQGTVQIPRATDDPVEALTWLVGVLDPA